MKVLNVNMSLDAVSGGGTAERTCQMSRFLAEAGVDCTILSTDVGLTAERINELRGVEVIALPCMSRRFCIPWLRCRNVCNTVASCDIVHLMGHWTMINALVYSAAQRLRKPYVVCPAGALPIYGRSKLLKKLYNAIVGKRMIRHANGHIASTRDELRAFEQYGVARETVTVIPNGVDGRIGKIESSANFRKKFGLPDEPFILFMGRLNSIKGPDLLLRAFCETAHLLPGIQLVFAGVDEGMQVDLQKEVNHYYAAGRVHFVGYVGGVDKDMAYDEAELLVVPSRQEVISMVALEAAVRGTPVLVTDSCGFPEIAEIEGGKVVSTSVEGLKKGLVAMLSRPEALSDMGMNLKTYVRANFDWSVITAKYINLYEEILTDSKIN